MSGRGLRPPEPSLTNTIDEADESWLENQILQPLMKEVEEKLQDPLQMYLSDMYTISASLAGIPAISLPCGFSDRGLPIGLQLMGRPFEEATLLRAAYAYEQATKWRKKRPPIR